VRAVQCCPVLQLSEPARSSNGAAAASVTVVAGAGQCADGGGGCCEKESCCSCSCSSLPANGRQNSVGRAEERAFSLSLALLLPFCTRAWRTWGVQDMGRRRRRRGCVTLHRNQGGAVGTEKGASTNPTSRTSRTSQQQSRATRRRGGLVETGRWSQEPPASPGARRQPAEASYSSPEIRGVASPQQGGSSSAGCGPSYGRAAGGISGNPRVRAAYREVTGEYLLRGRATDEYSLIPRWYICRQHGSVHVADLPLPRTAGSTWLFFPSAARRY
jgi:hypothetical protein